MSDPLTDRLPPHSREAERGVIGGILHNPEILAAVLEAISPDDFFFDAHVKVARALADLAAEGKPIELVSLHELLIARRHIEDVGGAAYLADLYDAVPTGANAEYHAKIVRDNALVRGLIHTTNEILRDAYDRVQSADELVAAAERRVMDIARGAAGGGDGFRASPAYLRDALERIQDRIAAGERLAGVPTGYPDLDDMLGGLKPGELTILAARPSQGKTALALCVARNAAEAGTPVAVFSMEQGEDEVACRLLSAASGVPTHPLTRGGRLTPDQAGRLLRAAQPRGAGVYLNTRPALTAAQVGAAARRAVARHGVGLVVIDYLQLMQAANPRENRTQQVGQLSRDVKAIARACRVPVLCLAQLNRQSEDRGDRKPRLSDLRDSGSIEQDADNVLLLWPHPDQAADAEVWMIDVDVAKQRNGPTGPVTLAYRRPVVRFENAVAGRM